MRFSLRWNSVGILGIGAMSAFLFSAGVAVGRVHLPHATKTLSLLCGIAAVVVVNTALWMAFGLLRRASHSAQDHARTGGTRL